MSRPNPTFLVMFSVFLVIAFFLWRAADRAVAVNARLDVEGVVIAGIITDLETGTLANSGGQRYYEIRYRYTVGGVDYGGATRRDRTDWQQARRDGPIEVTYLPEAPEIQRTIVHDIVGAGLPWRILSIIFLAVGGFGLFYQFAPKRPRNT